MPQKITQFRVFISSPDELSAEAQIIDRCLSTLNQEFAHRAISFRSVHWRKDVASGLGSDQQDVVNSQIEYDIYVGLLGSYFGSPTPRAGSGTEEEYRRSVARYVADPTAIRVLFYFKTSNLNVLRINLEHLKKVQDFRAETSQQGLLSFEFASDDELARIFTEQFRILVETQWQGDAWKRTNVSNRQGALSTDSSIQEAEQDGSLEASDEPADVEAQEEQDGVWDLVVTVIEATQVIGSTLEQLSAASVIFTKKLASGSEQLGDPKLSARQKRDLIDALAASMSDYSDAFNHANPVFTASTLSCLKGMEDFWRLQQAGEITEEQGFRKSFESFSSFVTTIKDMRQQIQILKSNVARSGRLTRTYAASQRRMLNHMDVFIAGATIFVSQSLVFIEDVNNAGLQ